MIERKLYGKILSGLAAITLGTASFCGSDDKDDSCAQLNYAAQAGAVKGYYFGQEYNSVSETYECPSGCTETDEDSNSLCCFCPD